MIVKIEGLLESVEQGAAVVRLEGGMTYQVLLPAYAAARLAASVGQTVRLHTLYYLESQGQGSNFIPRLAGFLTPEDKRFFELFTTCKGIGNRKALRAMALQTPQIAAAIADRDASLLKTLPEIGARMAETIVATLHGKVNSFLDPSLAGAGSASIGPDSPASGSSLAREALEVLLTLGENRTQAITWIDQALRDETKPANVEQLISRVYRIKTTG